VNVACFVSTRSLIKPPRATGPAELARMPQPVDLATQRRRRVPRQLWERRAISVRSFEQPQRFILRPWPRRASCCGSYLQKRALDLENTPGEGAGQFGRIGRAQGNPWAIWHADSTLLSSPGVSRPLYVYIRERPTDACRTTRMFSTVTVRVGLAGVRTFRSRANWNFVDNQYNARNR